ncbi:MAG: nuclear transport factor 2 family protein [Zoogloeaceae bacterium]|jgi:hypothetical protein|nr:nuclear transport factor 2 family protein [Zoogloeaceae bacterium]
MDLKKIILLICVSIGLWFAWDAANNRALTEERIFELYREAGRALMNNDGKAYCALFSDDLSGNSETRMPGMPVERKAIAKKDACAAVDDLHALKRKMEEGAKVTLYFNHEFHMDSVTLAPDKKSATVTSREEIRIGTERGAILTLQSRSTDKLRQRSGKIQVFQSDSSMTAFPGNG